MSNEKDMYVIEYHKDISDSLNDILWSQKVNLDDWDYLLFIASPEAFEPDYDLDKLLNGCCDNKWYFVKDFNGRPGMVGVAYHA